jgi:hypothetical protein
MTDKKTTPLARRQFLRIVSSSALAMPVLGLAGCGDDKSAATPAASEPATETKPSEPNSQIPAQETPDVEMATTSPAPAGSMPKLDESDPQANALGYVALATAVDATKYPQYSAGKDCSNCALYTASADSEWGPCSIFPGKLVAAKGWCSVYAPKM